jgi:hypothetical protein
MEHQALAETFWRHIQNEKLFISNEFKLVQENFSNLLRALKKSVIATLQRVQLK